MDGTSTQWLACPRCRGPLIGTSADAANSGQGTSGEALRCIPCRTEYPAFDGLINLFPEPLAAVADWRNRWRLERQTLFLNEQRVKSAQPNPRLQRLGAGYALQRQSIEALLQPMLGTDQGGGRETQLALRTQLPSHHAPSSYADNICRDWVWGMEETNVALELLLASNALTADARVVVLGAGAGGLSYALAEHVSEVIAVDSNPLLGLIARRMNGGNDLQFVEFPLSPREEADVAVTHTLTAQPSRTNICHLWCDALNLPIAEKSVDVVVTHWLVDVVDAPLDKFAAALNSVLTDGGVWLNQGSLTFQKSNVAENIGLEEALQQVSSQGFALPTHRSDQVTYVASPHSRQHRSEEIISWHAIKEKHIRPRRYDHRPKWLASSNIPVPLNESFQTQAAVTRIHGFVMSLIDGQRSVRQMAQELERQGLMPSAEAEAAIHGMLATMWEESQR